MKHVMGWQPGAVEACRREVVLTGSGNEEGLEQGLSKISEVGGEWETDVCTLGKCEAGEERNGLDVNGTCESHVIT